MDTPVKATRRSATGRRYSGRAVAMGVVAILGTVVPTIVTLWHFSKEPKGLVLAVAGVDAESVFALRRGFEERGYIHLVHAERDGDVTWSETLFGIRNPPSVAVDEGRVFVRVTDARGYPALHAFDIATGRFLWSGPVPTEPERAQSGPPVPSLHATGGRVWDLAGYEGDAEVEVTVIDATDGSLVGRARVGPFAGAPDAFIDDGSLVIHAEGWLRVGRDGQLDTLDTPPPAPRRQLEAGESCPASVTNGVLWSCVDGEISARDI